MRLPINILSHRLLERSQEAPENNEKALESVGMGFIYNKSLARQKLKSS